MLVLLLRSKKELLDPDYLAASMVRLRMVANSERGPGE